MMPFLRIYVFIIGGICGCYIINVFYSRPKKNELINNKINYLKKTEHKKVNLEKTPDPVIDNALVIWVSYSAYVFFAENMTGFAVIRPIYNFYRNLVHEIILNHFPDILLRDIHSTSNNVYMKCVLSIFLLTCSIIFTFIFSVKFVLSLFSSLIFGVHSFPQNLTRSFDIKDCFKSELNLVLFIFFTILFLFGSFLIATVCVTIEQRSA